MKKHFKLLTFVILSGLFVISCNDDNNNPEAEAIGLEQQEEQIFAGEKTINEHLVNYKVAAKSEFVFTTTLEIDAVTLYASVNYQDQSIDFDGKDAVLTLDQKQTLLDLGKEISNYLFKGETTDQFSMAEFTLLRLLEYWAKSPTGYPHKKTRIASSVKQTLKNRDEGITCIRKNTFVTATYDDDRGNIRESILVNGEDCIGRCGSGCGSFFTIASAWTKDCLDHDRCGRVNGSSFNPFDSECGDEYREAADDYLFGVIRGCRG